MLFYKTGYFPLLDIINTSCNERSLVFENLFLKLEPASVFKFLHMLSQTCSYGCLRPRCGRRPLGGGAGGLRVAVACGCLACRVSHPR